MSLTDGGIQPTMPVTPTGVNNGGWGGFGGDGWWIILFFIVLFGWGGFGGNRGGVTDGYVLTSDFSNIARFAALKAGGYKLIRNGEIAEETEKTSWSDTSFSGN